MIPERDDPVHLSEAGAARRDQMLQHLLGEVKTVHRRRRTRRRIALAAAPVLIIALGASLWRANSSHRSPPTQPSSNQLAHESATTEHSPPSAAPAHESMIVQYVNTDPGIAERFRATAVPNAVRLDDEGLLEALARLNRPAGLIRSQGRAWLTADVTDQMDHQRGG